MGTLLTIILSFGAGALVGVLVYRNNVNVMGPIGDILDEKFDYLEEQIRNLKADIRDKETEK